MRSLMNGRLLWGFLLLAGGLILLLNQTGVTAISLSDAIGRLWPVVLIYYGGVGLIDGIQRGMTLEAGESRGILWGTVAVNSLILLMGTVALGSANNWFEVRVDWFWDLLIPFVLIVAGIRMMQGGLIRPGSRTVWAVMGGFKFGRTDWQLADLAVVAIMGGGEIDLSRVRLPESGEVLLDIYTLMGGTEIKLPESLAFTLEGLAIMGGTDAGEKGGGGLVDYRVIEGGSGPLVRIRSHSIMGGTKVLRV